MCTCVRVCVCVWRGGEGEREGARVVSGSPMWVKPMEEGGGGEVCRAMSLLKHWPPSPPYTSGCWAGVKGKREHVDRTLL